MVGLRPTAPFLYIQGKGDESTKVALHLTQAPEKMVVRLTGGCGFMLPEDAHGFETLFVEAFDGYRGAFLFGGTRMLRRDDPQVIVSGITEVPPLIRELCPDAKVLGVVPRTGDNLRPTEHGLVVADDPQESYFTIIHPNQDVVVVLQESVDRGVLWDAEYQECMRMTELLRTFAGFRSLLVSWNGGGVTEKEIVATAARGWPVLLIAGSGRKTDAYANDPAFLAAHPNVVVADRTTMSIRNELIRTGALPDARLTFCLVAREGR